MASKRPHSEDDVAVEEPVKKVGKCDQDDTAPTDDETDGVRPGQPPSNIKTPETIRPPDTELTKPGDVDETDSSHVDRDLRQESDEEIVPATTVEEKDVDTTDGTASDAVDKTDGLLDFLDSSSLPKYDLRTKSQPCVFIFNNSSNREGSMEDACQLSTLFENTLQFRVVIDDERKNPPVWDNLTANQFKNVIVHKISGPSANYSDVGAVFIVVMTHGTEYGQLLFHGDDGSEYSAAVDIHKDLVEPFCRRNPSLVGKPKVFILPACRGLQHFPGMAMEEDSVDGGGVLPITSDVLVAYSTSSGQVSVRDWVTGSWYVKELVDVVTKYHKKYHFTEMLTEVHRRVAEKTGSDGTTKVMPEYVSKLRKRLYLKP